MEKGCKFYIVMFQDSSFPNYINQVQCVPHLWVTTSEESGFVNVSYPSCDLEIDLVLKKVDEFPSVNWSFYQAKSLYSTSSTKDAAEKLAVYRATSDALQGKMNHTPKMSKETEAKKRKIEDPCSSNNQATPSSSRVIDLIDLDESYVAPTLAGFQEVNEARMNATNTLTDDEEEQNECTIDTDAINFPAMFKELRTRIMLTLHEIQSQIDPDYKSTECDVEIHQNESETNLFPLRGIGSNPNHMNFTAPGPNIVELMPDTGVYVQKLRLDYIENLKEPKLMIAILLKAIFTEDSLQTFGLGQLNQKALFVLYLFMLQKYSLTMEETRVEVVKFLKTNKRQSKAVMKPRV